MIRVALLIAALLAGGAAAYGQGLMMFGYGSGGNASAAVSVCANGNLLLVYSDPCSLMSQMVGN